MKQKEPSKQEFHDATHEMEQYEVVLEENLSQSEYDTLESKEDDGDIVVPICMIRAYQDSSNTGSDYNSSIEEYYAMEHNQTKRRDKEIIEESVGYKGHWPIAECKRPLTTNSLILIIVYIALSATLR